MPERPPILVAVAWPYANGPLHLGHVAGSILPPDIFARYHRLRGRRVVMVSGSDMHGTPITVAAEKAGETPEAFAEKNRTLHVEALKALDVHFDLFTSTATENHREVVHEIFLGLQKNGLIERRPMTAPYDPKAKRFLPDRYVEGTCPHCAFPDARGDQCDNCGKTLDPQELKNPRSKLTGTPPEYRETEHFFLLLSKLEPDLKAWVALQAERGAWRPTVRNFTENWLKEGLKDRAITRDLTYGVPIPAAAGDFPDKRIYVWFEAVVGYLSAPRELDADGWERHWRERHSPEHHYFLGKDNIPFHTIIWPAMIIGWNRGRPEHERLALPFDVPANEFLQFGGAKFSKSRGNAFYVLDLRRHFDSDAIRYYLTINMPERGDTEWTWPDFVAKVNDELLAALGNYVNRVLAFCQKNWGGAPPGGDTIQDYAVGSGGEAFPAAAERAFADIAALIEAREFKKAMRAVIALSQKGNKAIDDLAPWALVKQGEDGKRKAGDALLTHLRVIKGLSLALAPFLPVMSERIWAQLGETGPSPRARSEDGKSGTDDWPTALPPISGGRRLGDVKPLVTKLDLKAVLEEFQDATTMTPSPTPTAGAPAAHAAAPPAPAGKPQVTIDDFAKLDLRVGRVLSCEPHPKADKIWVLQVDLGAERRQILAGLREHVTAEDLVGTSIVVIANLAPRQIRGLESQGMVLAAEAGGVVAPLRPARDVDPGAGIK